MPCISYGISKKGGSMESEANSLSLFPFTRLYTSTTDIVRGWKRFFILELEDNSKKRTKINKNEQQHDHNRWQSRWSQSFTFRYHDTRDGWAPLLFCRRYKKLSQLESPVAASRAIHCYKRKTTTKKKRWTWKQQQHDDDDLNHFLLPQYEIDGLFFSFAVAQ